MSFFNSDHIAKVLVTEQQLEEAITKLGAEITKDYEGKKPVIVGVLKGSVPFMADLIRKIDLQITIDFMSVSSYGEDTVSSGVVKILKDLDSSITGKDIIIVEDILDTGNTLSYMVEMLEQRKPNSIKIATLLDKKERRIKDINADYSCFVIPNEFVVGYGLDYNNEYRNLPFIGVLDPKVYS